MTPAIQLSDEVLSSSFYRPDWFKEWESKQDVLNQFKKTSPQFHAVSSSDSVSMSKSSYEQDYFEPKTFLKSNVQYFDCNFTTITENMTQAYEVGSLPTIADLSAFLPVNEEYESLLDWDAYIESPPPPIRTGKIKMKFKCIGWSTPSHINEADV